MKNVEFVDKYTLRFYKPWKERELDIARSIGFRIEGEALYADTRVISAHAIRGFMDECFPVFMRSDRDKFLRDHLFGQIRAVYKGIFQDFKDNYYSKAQYDRELFKHQKHSLALMIHRQHNLLSYEQGLGKEQPIDSEIVTPNGISKMGHMKVGSEIIGSDGNKYNVTGVYPQGKQQVYKIHLSDGTNVECGLEHLWIIQTKHDLKSNKRRVLTTNEIIDSYKNKRLYIPFPKPINFNSKETKLDPYCMGLLLGDGGFTNQCIRFTTADEELIKPLNKIHNDIICKPISNSRYHYILCSKTSKSRKNPSYLNSIIKEYGLKKCTSKTKFIPEEFLYNSIEVRTEILRGLMDTDGTICEKGTISFTSISKKMSEQVAFLVRSLGGRAYIYSFNIKQSPNKIYRVNMSFENDLKIFKLKRKLSRINHDKKFTKRLKIVNITKEGIKEQQCISVDSPDNSYLTNNCIVTHNTITSATLSKVLRIPRTIVICPAGVKWSWFHDMTDDWGYDKLMWTILDAKKSKSIYAFQERFVVINYEMINKHFDHLTKFNAGHIIIDECQKIKNTKTKNYKAVQKLVKHFPKARVTLLSGTPITNRVDDLFAYFKLCGHPLGANYLKFLRDYTITDSVRGGTRVMGAKNVDELRLKISNFMIRKRTEECLDLPDLLIKKYHFEMGDIKGKYEEKMKELYATKQELDNAEGVKAKNQVKTKIKANIHTLNRLLATSKVRNVIPLIDQLVENGRDVIVFSGYRDPIFDLERHYGEQCVKVIGGMDAHEKNAAIQKFVKDKSCNVFLGNFKAAGVGINLVNSRDVIFLNFPFTPDDLEQPYKRAHRIGQEHNVNVYYTIVKESIDEHIFSMIVGKTKDINSILDEGKDGVVHYNQIPNELFNRLIADYEVKNNIKQEGFASVN